jgi:hypothetical protein
MMRRAILSPVAGGAGVWKNRVMPGRSSSADHLMATRVGRRGSAGARRVRRIHDYGAISSEAPSRGRHGRCASYPEGTEEVVRAFLDHLDEHPRHTTMAEACVLTWRDGYPVETGYVPMKDRPGKGLKRALVEFLPTEPLETGPLPEADDDRWGQRVARAGDLKRDFLEDRTLHARHARAAMRSAGIRSGGDFAHDVFLSAQGEPLAFEEADEEPDIVKLTGAPWNDQTATATSNAYTALALRGPDLEHHRRTIDEATRDELDWAMSVLSHVEGIREHPQALVGAILALVETTQARQTPT